MQQVQLDPRTRRTHPLADIPTCFNQIQSNGKKVYIQVHPRMATVTRPLSRKKPFRRPNMPILPGGARNCPTFSSMPKSGTSTSVEGPSPLPTEKLNTQQHQQYLAQLIRTRPIPRLPSSYSIRSHHRRRSNPTASPRSAADRMEPHVLRMILS